MKILNLILVFFVLAMVVMPAMAATGEDNVKIIGADGNEVSSGISSQEDNKETENAEETESSTDDLTGSDGFNKLLSAPIKGVDYLLSLGPMEKLALLVVGAAIGGSIIMTIISFAVNNGRISWGSIFGKYDTMLHGRNWMAFVFLGFLGFLFALALMKFLGSTTLF